jgi:hypothetical protein
MALKRFIVEMDDYMAAILKNSGQIRIIESVSRHCLIYKANDGKWYVELGDYEHQYEDCPTYGPFGSYEDAENELDYHSNPGGWNIDESGTESPPSKLRRPAKEARANSWMRW